MIEREVQCRCTTCPRSSLQVLPAMDGLLQEIQQLAARVPAPAHGGMVGLKQELGVIEAQLQRQRDQAAQVPFYGDPDPPLQVPLSRATCHGDVAQLLFALAGFTGFMLELDADA